MVGEKQMGSRESSFHIGDGFNGKGKKVYITASTYKTYEPLSQENVRLTPSFRHMLLIKMQLHSFHILIVCFRQIKANMKMHYNF